MSAENRLGYHPFYKVVVFLLCGLPLAYEVWLVAQNRLGPDPAEHLSHWSGEWALYMLFVTLLVTPLRSMVKPLSWLIRLRRMLGLWSFFYAALHLLVFVMLYLQWDLQRLVVEVVDRPYVAVGFAAFIILLALALTSNRKAVRALGGKRWQRLHRLVYWSVGLVVVHVLWLSRSDLQEAVVYAFIAAGLLLFRVPVVRQKISLLQSS